MSSGKEFLSNVTAELTRELVKRMEPSGVDPPADPAEQEATWQPVARLMVNLIVAAWLKTAEETEQAVVVEAKDAWETRRSQADLPKTSGLPQDAIAKVEAAAWEVLTRTPELAQTAYFKMNDRLYMLRRTNGAITAQPFPAP